MRIIKCLTEYINEELHDAQKYAEKALKVKADYPEVAEVFENLSNEELKHMYSLHGQVTRLIENYRKLQGEPPANMLAVYEYLHEEAIKKEKEVRLLQQMYMEK